MKLILDENNVITGAISLSSGTQGVDYDGATPDDFEINFKPGWYKLDNGVIVVNPDYTEPTVDVPSGPTEQDRINAQLLKSTAQNAAANAAIVKQLATIASAGTDKEEAK